jgi:hypothetical protein
MADLYESTNKKYKLKKNKLISVVSELCNYANSQEINGTINRNYGYAFIHGNGKSLEIITSAVNPNGSISMFTLAELSEGKDKLSLRVYSHPSVIADPSELYAIGEKYKRKGCKVITTDDLIKLRDKLKESHKNTK